MKSGVVIGPLDVQIKEMAAGHRGSLEFSTLEEAAAFTEGFNLGSQHPEWGPFGDIKARPVKAFRIPMKHSKPDEFYNAPKATL